MKYILSLLTAAVFAYSISFNIRHKLKYEALDSSYTLLSNMMIERQQFFDKIGAKYSEHQRELLKLRQQNYILRNKQKRLSIGYWNKMQGCSKFSKN